MIPKHVNFESIDEESEELNLIESENSEKP